MVKKQSCIILIQKVFIVYIKTDGIYKAIAEDVETRFDTSNYELDRSLPKGKNKKVIGLMKYESGKTIITTACYYHVTYDFKSESTLYSLPEYQGAPCLKQEPCLKIKWL